MMRFVWAAALKDLRILRREPFSVATWVGIPLCIGILIQLIFGGGDVRPHGVLLVADQDRTVASRLLTNAFSSEGLGKMITVEPVDEAPGHRRIDRGDGSALLVIPNGLQDAFLNNRPYELKLFTNAGERILPSMIEQSLRTMVDGAYYLQRGAASELRPFSGNRVPSDAELALGAVAVRRLAEEINRYVSPPLIGIETVAEQEKTQHATVGDWFFPNLIFLSLLLMANGLSTDIWKERMMGTLRRVAVSPSSIGAFLAGRLVMVAMVFGMIATASVLTAKYVAGATVVSLPAAAVWAAACGTIFYLFLLTMAVSSTGSRGADIRGNLLVFPLAMIGGCFFPFEMLPDWMARVGRWTPNGMAVLQFQHILRGTAEGREVAMVFGLLSMAGGVAFWLSARRLKGELER